ncbi:YbaY family lipoprotein [Deinococcus apachensis]|uniref:YbaY family lipoprotein n=1 Tax=Deinococcus apachensis TaxID=309886 RepID=UPI000361B313|nr:YbaY family lipoprotein [Deinococcus apachensis]
MKRLLAVLLAALLAAPAAAQIRITRPTTPPATTASTTAPDLSDVPAGYRVVSGRVRAGGEVRLPAGSTVRVSLVDVTGSGTVRKPLVDFSFSTPRLSTPYQMQFNPVRLNPGRMYAVTAQVYGPNGRLLYSSVAPQELPQGRNVVLDLRVAPVR